jgi:hypothetical protein
MDGHVFKFTCPAVGSCVVGTIKLMAFKLEPAYSISLSLFDPGVEKMFSQFVLPAILDYDSRQLGFSGDKVVHIDNFSRQNQKVQFFDQERSRDADATSHRFTTRQQSLSMISSASKGKPNVSDMKSLRNFTRRLKFANYILFVAILTSMITNSVLLV